MKYFQNKYRTTSIRLPGWDYSSPWWYYVTIAAKNHAHFFGKVISGKMELNEIGMIADNYWKDIPKHYPKVELDYFVVMPNHLHGIKIITERVKIGPDDIGDVDTRHGVHLNENIFGKPISNSLSMIINHYKGAVKHLCNQKKLVEFKWQPKFYDRIIRNEKELFAIRKYIADNPIRWEIEKNIPTNLDIT